MSEHDRGLVSVVIPAGADEEAFNAIVKAAIPEGFEFDAGVIASLLGNEIIVSGFGHDIDQPKPVAPHVNSKVYLDMTYTFGIVRKRN